MGLFGPGSQVWQVDREAVVLLGSGTRALLLQVAHPKVAAAVAHHSRYASDPLGRLRHTLDAIYGFAFADTPAALRSIEQVNRLHVPVRGTLNRDVGRHGEGATYRALDPHLLLWVYATLIDSSLLAYQQLVAPLADEAQERYYQEMRAWAHLWGIPRDLPPPTLGRLRAWMGAQVRAGEVAVSDEGRTIARRLMRSPVAWLPDAAMIPANTIATWLLPSELRVQFGLDWGPRRERLMRGIAHLSRRVVPRLPRVVRDMPQARVAVKRARRAPELAAGRMGSHFKNE